MRFLMPRTTWPQRVTAAVVVVTFVAAAVLVALAIYNNVEEPSEEAPKVPALSQDERDPARFGQVYPRHYALYLKTGDTSRGPSRYGGSDQEDKLEAYPYLRTIFAGYSFSKEYK